MTINPIALTLVALFFSAVGILFKFINKIQSEIKEGLKREFLQDQDIKECAHQIELLEQSLDDFKDRENDRYLLLKNQIDEGIEHARNRFFDDLNKANERLKTVESKLNKTG